MPRFPIDINSAEGQAAVKGQWRYAEATSPARPTTVSASGWKAAPAACRTTTTQAGRSAPTPAHGPGSAATTLPGFSFVWYRINITVPETVGGRDVRRTRLLFETCVDDYGEIWINGECNRERGTVEGFNRPQRVEVANNPNPGDEYTVAILAANGPLGAPGGGVFVRYTNLSFEWRDDDP